MEEGYIQVTTSAPPSSKFLLDESNLPFACIIKPFLPTESIPSVVFPGSDIVRCASCKGYINPYCDFQEGGVKWCCNLCKTINAVPSEYFANLNSAGKRIDLEKRVELTHNSIDINAPESYTSRPPMPCVFLFLIDISLKAQEHDFTGLVSSTLTNIIESQVLPGHPRTEVSLIFFDKHVHFVNLASETPSIFTITDFSDIFLPLPSDKFLVSIEDAEGKLVKALELIKTLPAVPYSTCYRGALRAAGLLLSNQGGKIIAFCGEMLCESSHPLNFTFAQNTRIYTEISEEFYVWNVSLTQYIKASQFSNFYGLMEISQLTGGQVYFYPNFNSRFMSEKLRNEVILGITTTTAWECSVKFRHSSEWKIGSIFGNYTVRDDGLLGIPVYNYPQTLTFELSPTSVSFQYLYLQSAMLYTNCEGERKLRIHNSRLTTTDSLKDLIANANCDALVNFICKKALNHMIKSDKPTEGNDFIENSARKIIKTCHKIWGRQPERLDFFCASILGLLKNPIFQNKNFGYNLNFDNFSYYKFLFCALGSDETGVMAYPRLYPIHEDFSRILNLTYKSLDPTGAYLLDTGVEILIWVGLEANPDLLSRLFENPKANTHFVYTHGTIKDNQVLDFIERLRGSCGVYQTVLVMMSGDTREQHFFGKLIEDITMVKMTYEEFYNRMIS